jgi:hypothetical protein
MLCEHCGSDLSGVPNYGVVRVCPECRGSTEIAPIQGPRPKLDSWLLLFATGLGLSLIPFALAIAGGHIKHWAFAGLAMASVPIVAMANGAIAARITLRGRRENEDRRRRLDLLLAAAAFVGVGIITALLAYGAIEAGSILGAL